MEVPNQDAQGDPPVYVHFMGQLSSDHTFFGSWNETQGAELLNFVFIPLPSSFCSPPFVFYVSVSGPAWALTDLIDSSSLAVAMFWYLVVWCEREASFESWAAGFVSVLSLDP